MQNCFSQPVQRRFCWRVGLSGDVAGVQDVWVSPETVLGRFVCELLPADVRAGATSAWCAVFPNDRAFRGYFDTPFASLEEGRDVVEVTLLRMERWADAAMPVSRLCWRDLPTTNVRGQLPLLEELLALPPEVDGVRGWTTFCGMIYFAFDDRFIFLELPRYADVIFSAKDDLTIDGASATVRSTWLFSDPHTPLREVREGESLDVHLSCAQYTTMHLCFELDSPVPRLPCEASLTLHVGMLQSGARQDAAQLGFVSPDGGWALKEGCVSFSVHSLRFLLFHVTYSFQSGFSGPAPHLFAYRILAEPDDTPSSVFFEIHREEAAETWTVAQSPYCEQRVLRAAAKTEDVTSFHMEARRLTRGGD